MGGEKDGGETEGEGGMRMMKKEGEEDRKQGKRERRGRKGERGRKGGWA